MSWPPTLPGVRVRFARPTGRIEEVVRFYRDGLGLRELGRFAGHDGYDGVMLGLPGEDHHLEFTARRAVTLPAPGPPPDPDHLLVIYLADDGAVDAAAARLASLGYDPVPPRNPYWAGRGVTVPDPDGWRVVLVRPAVTP